MKVKLISMLVLLSIIISCKKDQQSDKSQTTTKIGDSSQNLSLAQVKQWYGSQETTSAKLQSQSTSKTFLLSSLPVAWDKIQSFNNKKGNYWLIHLDGQSTFQNVKQGYRKMAFIRDSTGGIQVRILEIIPDVLYIQRKQKATTADFTGRIFIYDQTYNMLGGKVYAGGKQIGAIKPKASNVSTDVSKLKTNMVQVITDCQWYDNNYIDGNGEVVIYSEKICSTTIYDDGGGGGFDGGSGDYTGGGGGGGGTASSAPAVANLPGETKPAVDPEKMMECFGAVSDAGASMKVTVYVQEPFPGTSFAVGPNSVGHVAIGLSKSNGGTTVNQIVGFYPNATGKDKINAPSKVVNNGGDLDYNVSITYTVTADQFSQITNYVANPPATYDLSNFNCTNFVYSACLAGSITLPDPYSTVGFNGATLSLEKSMTPAGLGSSLDDMKGASNVNANGGTTPNSKGPCN